MTNILTRYIQNRFWQMFLFILLGIIILFVVVDLVENVDKFLDKKVPKSIIFLYYLYFIPYILVITMPVATLLSTVFTVGTLARDNEMVAMKALGFSLYRVVSALLIVGFFISMGSFIISEGIAAEANKKKAEITRHYLNKSGLSKKHIRNIQIQEPPDQIVSMDVFKVETQMAQNVKIETFDGARLISRIDAPEMYYEDGRWFILSGFQRIFKQDDELARPVKEVKYFDFHFTPKELIMTQVRPDEMNFGELKHFIQRIRQSGGEVYRWLTDYYLRISFPINNMIIVLFSIPLAYNRRKKSLAVGFGLSLIVCFVFFGMIKVGQTLGQNGHISPVIGAWAGNIIMGVGGMIYLFSVRK